MSIEKKYLIIKRDLYYRHNSSGYTGIRDEAGRYSLPEAAVIFPQDDDSGLSYIHEDDAPEYTSACFYDLKLEHQLKKKASINEILSVALRDILDKSKKSSEAHFIAKTALQAASSHIEARK